MEQWQAVMRSSLYRRSMKRQLDVIFAVATLIVLAPAMLAIALLIYATMGRPILFRQQRVGYRETIFTLFKFRTMSMATGADGLLLPEAERLTLVGRFLRLTSLDELPQLWNILRGEMSLIGPRPLLIENLPYYYPRERVRHHVCPGITGLSQISGRNNLGWDERLALDAQYVEQLCFRLDASIFLVTVAKILRRSDVAIVTGPHCGGSLPSHRSQQQRAA